MSDHDGHDRMPVNSSPRPVLHLVSEEWFEHVLTTAARRTSAIDRVRELHHVEHRYQPYPDYDGSFDVPEDAIEEGIGIADVIHFDVCAECGRIEMAEDQTDRIDYKESLWPCPTIRVLDGDSR